MRMNARHSLRHLAGMAVFSVGVEEYIHEKTPSTFPRATTRGHFDVERVEEPRFDAGSLLPLRVVDDIYDVNLDDDETSTSYETAGGLDDVIDEEPDETVIFVHGWLANDRASLGRMSMMRYSLRENGYDGAVVGFTWDTDEVAHRWKLGRRISERNGPKLAQFVYDYKERTGSDVRLVSNSLGARVVLEAARSLYLSDAHDAVESISMMGAAVDADSVAVDSRYGEALRNAVGETHNYWISHDGILNQQYRVIELTGALGGTGADGDTPENYHDHRVSYVPDHYSFYRPGKGCVRKVIADWTEDDE
jgi:esterase/lipase superfamily enzyme